MAGLGMAEVGMAAGVAVVGAGAVSASELDCFSPLLVRPITADTPTATHPHTAMALMAMDIGAHTMATAAITPAIVTQDITPIVAITIAMAGTSPIVATHIAE